MPLTDNKKCLLNQLELSVGRKKSYINFPALKRIIFSPSDSQIMGHVPKISHWLVLKGGKSSTGIQAQIHLLKAKLGRCQHKPAVGHDLVQENKTTKC